MSKLNPFPWKSGDHLVVCDICGRQRYRSQCKYRWDGVLCCTVSDCWDIKDPIFENPPVINDPQTLLDVRPDRSAVQETFVDGLYTTFGNATFTFSNNNGKRFGSVDTGPDYWN